MTGDPAQAWPGEIRDYLVGRLAKGQQSVTLAVPQTQRLSHAPIRRWWIFEGKHYASIEGTLSTKWAEVLRAARLLERTFNPRLKLSERADGTVDWPRTLARGSVAAHPEYVLQSSGVGLSEEEHAALRGWMHWLASEWIPYAQRFGLDLPSSAKQAFETLALLERESDATVEQLRRWVHIARRSRWPLLRDLVAESLRPAIEADALDQIPLPQQRSTLFELLCLVRIARRIAPSPGELRWLDFELSENKIILEGTTCWFQQTLDRGVVLSTPDFEHGLGAAAPMFGLRVPQRADLAFDLDPPRRGISAILVEAKSGAQAFDDTVAQLRVYRRARPRAVGQRCLVWGIVENTSDGEITDTQLDYVRHQIDSGEGDVWVFSTADSIGPVLQLLGCKPDGG